ncbi:9896_t:CDS:2 [Ambispora gerdemannii]|uniref:9896_t:CDS:1 n=1 Tax=Ambispora gerdemannii TaxID=144530 RepID=A0A9N9ADM0_9GLOM|nr:9896_t:CDS:2 [Ambispora gerdemannii]
MASDNNKHFDLAKVTNESSSSDPRTTKNTKESDYEDCYACKLVAGTAFIGLGLYALRQRRAMTQFAKKSEEIIPYLRLRSVGLNIIGISAIGAGMYRIAY